MNLLLLLAPSIKKYQGNWSESSITFPSLRDSRVLDTNSTAAGYFFPRNAFSLLCELFAAASSVVLYVRRRVLSRIQYQNSLIVCCFDISLRVALYVENNLGDVKCWHISCGRERERRYGA